MDHKPQTHRPRHVFAARRVRAAFDRSRLTFVCVVMCLSACTTIDETALAVFASNTPAAGLFAGRVMQGTASFARAREATLHLQSADAPRLACFGDMRLTATSSGVATLSCSNGQTLAIPFQLLSPLRGLGRVQAGGADYALTYGLTADTAAAYLGVPVERLGPTP